MVFHGKDLWVLMYFSLFHVHQHYHWVLADILLSYRTLHHHISSHRPAASLKRSWILVDLHRGLFPIRVCHVTVLQLTTVLPRTSLPLLRLPSPVQRKARHRHQEPLIAALFMDAKTVLLSAIHWRAPHSAQAVPIKSRAPFCRRWCQMKHGHVIDHVQWWKLQTLQDTCTAWALPPYIHWNRYDQYCSAGLAVSVVLIKFVTEVGTGIRVAFGPGVLWHIKKGWGQWVIFCVESHWFEYISKWWCCWF